MDYIGSVSGGMFAYDIRYFDEDWNKIEQPHLDYLGNHTKLD
jgi:hypothetical protein